MYHIISVNGDLLGTVDSVYYIKIGAGGSFTPTEKSEAIGVALKGVAYNLIGHDEIEGADTVVVSAFDGGEYVAQQQKVVDELLLTMLEG